MNAMNMLISYVFAQNSAQKYNVADKQKLQSLALVSSIISPNPIFNYLIVENEAKKLEVVQPAIRKVIVKNSDAVDPKDNLTTDQTHYFTKEELYQIVKNASQKALKEGISTNILKPDNPKVIELEEKLQSYFINEQKESIKKLKSDYEHIIAHPFYNDLDESDKKKVEEYKNVLSKTIFNNYNTLIDENIKTGNSKLFIQAPISYFDSIFSSIKYRLERLQTEKAESNTKEEVHESKEVKKTTSKK